MPFVANAFALVKGAAICALALLLLLTPACGALCHSQMCDAHQPAAEKSACHESVSGAAADPADGIIHSAHLCTLREQPAAVPAEFRVNSISSVSLSKSSHGVAPIAALAFAHSVNSPVPAVSPDISRSQSPHIQSASSSLVRRI